MQLTPRDRDLGWTLNGLLDVCGDVSRQKCCRLQDPPEVLRAYGPAWKCV